MILDQNYLYEFRNRPCPRIYESGRRLDCGRSFARWGLLTGIFATLFAIGYTAVDIDYGEYETAPSPLYFSVVTMTTLGYGDAVPASMPAQLLVLVQVVLGYAMLGGVLRFSPLEWDGEQSDPESAASPSAWSRLRIDARH